MKDYFDENDNVFLKLYKVEDKICKYWETWKINDTTAMVHWGELGEYGDHIEIEETSFEKLKDEINKQIAQKTEEDKYFQIPIEDFYTVVITFELDNWGSPEDLERREAIRNVITEYLGWTGNGRCDDGDIGSGEMALYADEVIHPFLAIGIILRGFRLEEIDEDPYFTIMQGGEIVREKFKPEI
jgi:hypothetical protein